MSCCVGIAFSHQGKLLTKQTLFLKMGDDSAEDGVQLPTSWGHWKRTQTHPTDCTCTCICTGFGCTYWVTLRVLSWGMLQQQGENLLSGVPSHNYLLRESYSLTAFFKSPLPSSLNCVFHPWASCDILAPGRCSPELHACQASSSEFRRWNIFRAQTAPDQSETCT